MEVATKQSVDIVQDTKKHIIDIARHLFSERSYLGVSMSEIAKKLNITKAALYYHFTGKAEIYGKVLDDVFTDLSSTIGEALKETTAEKKLQKLIKNYLDFGSKENNLVKVLILKLSSNSPITKHIVQLREQVANLIQPVIEETAKKKKLTEKIDSRLLTSLLTSMMDGLLLEYSFLNRKINSARIAEQIIAVLF